MNKKTARAMTNESKNSFPLSLCNALEETYVRQNAKFSCICPCIIVTLRRRANDLPHLATQTYWIKKDVSPLFRSQENRQTSKTPRKKTDARPWFSTGCSSVSAYGYLAVPLRRQKQAVRVFLCPLSCRNEKDNL